MRIRTVKPEFWKNEHIATLDDFTQLLALGLLNYSDDEGYFNANPKLIQADIFPLRDVSGIIPVSVTKLSNLGYLRLYKASDGRTYGQIINFSKHQVINKPKPSKIKTLCIQQQGSLPFTTPLPDSSGLEQGTGNREPVSSPAKPARIRDELFDSLCLAEGMPLHEIGNAGGRIAKALKSIRAASPDVTPQEITRRAKNYLTHFPNLSLTANGLASHWGKSHEPKSTPLPQSNGNSRQFSQRNDYSKVTNHNC